MIAGVSLGTVRGVELTGLTGKVQAWRGGRLLGEAFPAVVAEPDGAWFARHRGRDARKLDSRREALAYLAGVGPDELGAL